MGEAESTNDVAAARPQPAHQRVTVLFADLSDSTELSARMEPEDYAQLQDDLHHAFVEVVERLGGLVNQVQGDGRQALFGYPAAGESDGLRAVEAALEIHERVRALRARFGPLGAPGLSVHSGVHAGALYTREGRGQDPKVELFGPAPGLAKHLSDEARRDEILVSDETLGPHSRLFVMADQRELVLKGRTEPLVAHCVVGRTGLRTRGGVPARPGRLPLMGRRAQLRELGAALTRAGTQGECFVAITGPVGVGKTRLADEFLQAAAAMGWGVLAGDCDDALSAEPLQPLLQVLRHLFGLRVGEGAESTAARLRDGLAALEPGLEVHVPALMQQLSLPAQGAPPAGPAALEAWIAAWQALLRARARSAPQLLFVDDWQWADETTRQIAHGLSHQGGLPLMLLVATRPLDGAAAALSGAQLVAVPPLDDAESRQSIKALLPQADPFLVEALCQRAGGNPLFIEELCHCAGQLGEDDPNGLLTGRVWLETLIESRVVRLPPRQAGLLAACAAIGTQVPAWQLRGLAGCDLADPDLLALAGEDLLFVDHAAQALRFKHGITRDVVYSRLGRDARRDMHRRLAALIRERVGERGEIEVCESLAHHLAGAAEPERAALFAQMAGDKALAASVLSRARAQYRAALALLDRLPAREQGYAAWRVILRRLGFVCVFDPARADLAVFDDAVARAAAADDVPGLAYAEYWRAYMHYALGDLRAAVKGFERAHHAALQADDAPLRVQLRLTRGQALAAAADYPRSLDLLDTPDDAPARRGHAALPAGRAFSLACKGSVLGDLGRFDDALACFDSALEALPRQGHEVQGSVLCWRSGVLLWQGRWADAHASADAAHRVAAQVKSLYLFAMSQALGAFARWRLGGGADAVRELADAAAWLVSRDKRLFVSLAHGWLAVCHEAGGQPDAARQQALQALGRRRQREWIGAAMAARVLARLAAAEGHVATAWRHLARAEQAAAVRQSPHEQACNRLCRAALHAAAGDAAAAEQARRQAGAEFARLGMHWHAGQAAAPGGPGACV